MNTVSQTVAERALKQSTVTEKTGHLVGVLDVQEKEDLLITCKSGIILRPLFLI
jgi:DNA gyrase subunit A